jgi:large subunit ribosomal protein L35
MPKLKTKDGVAKRFKLTKKKKITYRYAGKGHLLTNKKSQRIRRLRRRGVLEHKPSIKFIKRMLPYG